MSNESKNYYDHKREIQIRRPGWEAEPNNPIVQSVRQGIAPVAPINMHTAPETISLSDSGKQVDTSQGISWGIFIQSLPVIGLALPLAICIAGMAWLSGIVSAGFWVFVLVTLGLWGAIALFCYNWIARRAYRNSHYGTEHQKIASIERIRMQELSNEYHLRRAALDAYIKHLQGGDKND